MTGFVPISVQQRHGAQLLQAVQLGRQYQNALEAIKSVMDAMADDPDYGVIEAHFGLPAGTGQTTYNLVVGAYSQVNEPNTHALLARLG